MPFGDSLKKETYSIIGTEWLKNIQSLTFWLNNWKYSIIDFQIENWIIQSQTFGLNNWITFNNGLSDWIIEKYSIIDFQIEKSVIE